MPGKLSSFVRPLASAKSSLHNATNKAGRGSVTPQTMDMRKRHEVLLSKYMPESKKTNTSALKVDLMVESSPLVSFGPPNESSGAMFSGQLLITAERQTTSTLIEVKLLCSTTVKQPVVSNCNDCHGHTREIKTWSFETLTLNQGVNKLPLSYLFGGKLPATTHSQLCMLDYHLSATVKTVTGESLITGKILELKRALRVDEDTETIRLFPPTNISSTFTHAPVLHQTNDLSIDMCLKGLLTKTDKACLRWKLKRLTWRIEETEVIVSLPCPNHAAEQRENTNKQTRVIGEGEVKQSKTSWKSDWNTGEINTIFKAQIDPQDSGSIDVLSSDMGITISHNLVIDMLVMQEMAPLRNQTVWTPLGYSRSLCSEIPIQLSEREDVGIAWDEDTPPVYHEVPPSPPTYPIGNIMFSESFDLNRDLSDSSSIEDFNLGEPLSMPSSAASSFSLTTSFPSMATSSQFQAPPNMTILGCSPGLHAHGNMIGLSPRMQAELNRSREAVNLQRPSTSRRTSNLSVTSSRGVSMPMSEDDLLHGPDLPRPRLGDDNE